MRILLTALLLIGTLFAGEVKKVIFDLTTSGSAESEYGITPGIRSIGVRHLPAGYLRPHCVAGKRGCLDDGGAEA